MSIKDLIDIWNRREVAESTSVVDKWLRLITDLFKKSWVVIEIVLTVVVDRTFCFRLKWLHVVINGYWLYLFLIGIFVHFFLSQIHLESLNVTFHLPKLFLFDSILPTDLLERDVVLGHLFELLEAYISYYHAVIMKNEYTKLLDQKRWARLSI